MKTKMMTATKRTRTRITAATTNNLAMIAAGLIAILAVGVLTTIMMMSSPSAADSDHSSDQSKQGKDLRCDKDERGSGNPHDECVGS
jgi:hypothetical protein